MRCVVRSGILHETNILGSFAEIIFLATANFLVCFCFPMVDYIKPRIEKENAESVEWRVELGRFCDQVRSQTICWLCECGNNVRTNNKLNPDKTITLVLWGLICESQGKYIRKATRDYMLLALLNQK